jgi:diphthine synthase
MLYLIGLGLNDEEDLSLKAISAMKKCDEIYCELYTGIWQGDLKKLEKMAGKKIIFLGREKTESDFLVNEAEKKNVALLVPGDPLSATTHFELLSQAKSKRIVTEIVHSSSIFTAVAETGMQLYKFGRTASLPFPAENFSPESPYDIIQENYKQGLHTLILLDTARGGMNVKEALRILEEIEKKKKGNIISKTKIVVCSSLGSGKKTIKYDKAEDLIKISFGKPAVLIIPGKLNFKEEEALQLWQSKQ